MRPYLKLAKARAAIFAAISNLLLVSFATAQTPWETAPAKPAVIPFNPSTVAPKKVVDLPPPPEESATPINAAATTNSAGSPAVDGRFLPPLPKSPLESKQTPLSLPPIPSLGNLPPPQLTTQEAEKQEDRSRTASYNSASVDKVNGSLIGYEQMGDRSLAASNPEFEEFSHGQLVAVVGTDHVLAGDMNAFIEPVILQNRDRIGSKEQENEIRRQLTRQMLIQYVEIKAMYQEFFRDMVGTAPPKEIEDMKKQVMTRASRIFFEKQVPELLKKYEVEDLASLDTKLREKGLALSTLRTQFIEQVLSGELERKYVPSKFEVQRDEILNEYRATRSDWEIPARARWRQLTVRFNRHNSRQEAEDLIKQLGNEMVLGGKPFEAVAKQSSEGFTAADGGVYDWTSQNSLKSKILDEAIFTLPTGRLSQVIEDDIGFHIIEVLEREGAHSEDMAVIQTTIRDKLSNAKREEASEAFRQKVMKRTPVWTLWPEDIPGSRPLETAIGGVGQ